VKFSALLLISLSAVSAFAQQQEGEPVPPPAGNPNPVMTLASKFFERDFFNVFAYGSGVYDFYQPPGGQGGSTNSFGYSVGGGVNGYHSFRDGSLYLSYSGGYSNYHSTSLTSGTNQNLSLGYTKRLARRWTLSLSTGAGIYLYGGAFYSAQPNTINTIITNPLTPETKFFSSGVSLTYQQSRRLSYSFGGDFFLQRYNGVTGIGTTGGSGSASVNYRLNARTTASASYSHSHFVYQHNAGNADIDGISLSVMRQFPRHWSVSLYAGGSRSHTAGTLLIPVPFLGNGVYVLGAYDQVAYVPSFGGTISHNYRRSLLSFNAGQGISGAGNGVYLASRNQYISGVYSYNLRASSLSVAGSYFRLTSVANSVATSYSSGVLSASYSRNLVRFVSAFFRYDYSRYGSLSTYSGSTDNRLSFGLNFSSKSIPLTLF
jgi:hypothetical protein